MEVRLHPHPVAVTEAADLHLHPAAVMEAVHLLLHPAQKESPALHLQVAATAEMVVMVVTAVTAEEEADLTVHPRPEITTHP